jgi:PsbP
MKSLTILTCLLALMTLLVFQGCGKTEVAPVPVGKMNEYKDPGFGFTIHYPENWKQLGTIGKALFTESQDMATKFIDPTKGIEGGRVMVEAIAYEGKTPEAIIEAGKGSLQEQQAELSPQAAVTVGGKPSVKIPYSIQATTKAKIYGYEIYVPGDTALYKLTVEGYGDQYNAYAGVFDAMVSSFVVPVVVAKSPDTWSAAPTISALETKYFTMLYPDNMEFVDVKKGEKDYVVEMRADRQDVSLHIDVFGAVGLTVDKVWEQNKGRYKARGNGETTIDGLKTFWVDYTPMANVTSRAYFTVKNDKVVRTTLNWHTPKREVYFPVLEGMVKSLKLK